MGAQFAEVPMGLHVVRGENVVLLGEIDESRDPPLGLVQVRGGRREGCQAGRRWWWWQWTPRP